MAEETREILSVVLFTPLAIWLIACILVILARLGKLGEFGAWMLRKEKKVVAGLAIMFAFSILIAGVGAVFNGA